MNLKILDDEEEWDNFIKKNPDSSFQHTLEFKRIIERTYKNCKAKYFIFGNNKSPRIVFPFFIIKSKIFGNKAISMPFIDVGGFVGKITRPVLKKIIIELKKEDIKWIEIRTNNSFKNFHEFSKIFEREGFQKDKSARQQFIIKLKSEEIMWDNFHKHTRNDIRKAAKSKLKIKQIIDERELKKFYDIYLDEMIKFGTPQHSYSFFKNILTIKNNFLGLNCYLGQRMIASIILLHYKNNAYVAFNVSEKKFRNHHPNDLLYWKIVLWAIKNKKKFLDLGQVEKDALKGTHARGLFDFKKKWLGDLYERVYFQYFLEKSDSKLGKERYKKFRNLWNKLPKFLIKIIGPKICASLGT